MVKKFGPTPFLLQLLITDNDDDAEKDDDEIPLSIVVYIPDILFKACFVTHETCLPYVTLLKCEEYS